MQQELNNKQREGGKILKKRSKELLAKMQRNRWQEIENKTAKSKWQELKKKQIEGVKNRKRKNRWRIGNM